MKLIIYLVTIIALYGIERSNAQTPFTQYIGNAGNLAVTGTLNFTAASTMIYTERTLQQGFVSFSAGTSWTEATNKNFVDGYVRTYIPSFFVFPVGDNGRFSPVAVSASSASSPSFAAFYGVSPNNALTSNYSGGAYYPLPAGAPFPTAKKETGIMAVDETQYWDIKGTTPAKITLTWNNSSMVGFMSNYNLNNLTIVGWNGTQWVKIPSTVDVRSLDITSANRGFIAAPSTFLKGSITTQALVVPNTYRAYTLAGLGLTLPNPANAPKISIGYDALGNRTTLDTKPFKPTVTASTNSVKIGEKVAFQMTNCKGTAKWSVSSTTSIWADSKEPLILSGKATTTGSVTVQGTCVFEGGCQSPLSEPVTVQIKSLTNGRVGEEHLSEVDSIPVKNPTFMIFPNPSNGSIVRIKAQNMPKDIVFQLISVDGKYIPTRQQPLGEIIELLPCNAILPGVYFVTLLVNTQLLTQKLIVE